MEASDLNSEAERATGQDHDRVRPGGLMRCCTATISDLYPLGGPSKVATEGQTLQCKFVDGSNHRMIFREGAWEWDLYPAPDDTEPPAAAPDEAEAGNSDNPS